MSRRGRPNGVRGPTSALTSYLKEQGITAGPISVYSRRIGGNQEEAGGVSTDDQAAEENSADAEQNMGAGPSGPQEPTGSSKRKRQDSDGEDSDNLDDDEDEEPVATSSKRRRVSLAKEKAIAKAKAARKGRANEDEEGEDRFNALSNKPGGKASARPPIGSLEKCGQCGKKFPMTRYTQPATPGPGYLCHKCTKALGNDPFKKPVTQKRQREKRNVQYFEEKERVESLARLCIKVVTKHIDDVDALGDIGATNLDWISKIIARNRSLNARNALLFYDVENTTLTMYDCTALVPDALCTLASLNPRLESVRLDYCGRMNDTVFTHWCSALQHLKKLDLLGPFNVRSQGWVTLIHGIAQPLESFCITQSPRFDMGCLQALATRCQNSLVKLRLREFSKLTDEWLSVLASFRNLQSLDISYPATSVSEGALIRLLETIGGHLLHLDISGNEELGDPIIEDGLRPHLRSLVTLKASHLPLLTDDGVAGLFSRDGETPTVLPSLELIDLSRAPESSTGALTAILSHSGPTLRELNINGWKGASNEALTEIGTSAPLLKRLDIGWCRSADNFTVKSILDGCRNIQEILCAGCNRVSIDCPRKRGVSIRGIEAI
ncbi:uncharacterized protein EI90DRAFT_2054174 [Cantharellus anzutake]|uniref:uncharacterized protein n=1 Tax=Cantharellus anzutake TaxID=1750568 RepID=UPI001906064A|nr:uncharacterized protein EI90DRAFT_2054174 [Cantharellus anzutake]KAF8340365.1 hypothetical protein EI90DRAFT_2054174 [Cantharellus anzutake]